LEAAGLKASAGISDGPGALPDLACPITLASKAHDVGRDWAPPSSSEEDRGLGARMASRQRIKPDSE